MISANEINLILKQYLSTADGKALLKANGVNSILYDEAKLLQIAEDIKNEIIDTFISITNHASLIDAQDYFNSSYVKIGKVRHLKSGDRVSILFSPHSLFRPSFIGRNGQPTGVGVQDIFALITNGTAFSGKVYGYWTYYSEGMGYGAEEICSKAWLPRIGKPFIQNILNKYESLYPGLTITCPPEWR